MLKILKSIWKYFTQKSENPDKERYILSIILFCLLLMFIIMDTKYFSANRNEFTVHKLNNTLFLLGLTGIVKILTDFIFKLTNLFKSLKNVLDTNISSTYEDKTNSMWLLMDIPFLIIIIFHNSWSNTAGGLQISGVVGVLIFNMIKKIITNNKRIEDSKLSNRWKHKKKK